VTPIEVTPSVSIPDRELPSIERVSDFVAWYATRTPDAEAAVLGDQRLTYAALHDRVDEAARALLAAGIKKGDRVATLSPPNLDFWITFLASASIGAIWLGLNPRYKSDELRYLVGDAEPTLLFARCELGGRRYDDEIHC
jgi:fatty-acyl-CoA synthase